MPLLAIGLTAGLCGLLFTLVGVALAAPLLAVSSVALVVAGYDLVARRYRARYTVLAGALALIVPGILELSESPVWAGGFLIIGTLVALTPHAIYRAQFKPPPKAKGVEEVFD